MEEDLQETSLSNDKKTSFLSMSISKKTLIIIVCSFVCFLVVLLLFFVMSSGRKTHAQSFSRPSINGPRKPSGRDVAKQHHEQSPQTKPQMKNSEEVRHSNTDDSQVRAPRGIYKGETPEQAHIRHMREIEERKDPNYRPQERSRANGRRHKRERRENKPPERERPRLNS